MTKRNNRILCNSIQIATKFNQNVYLTDSLNGKWTLMLHTSIFTAKICICLHYIVGRSYYFVLLGIAIMQLHCTRHFKSRTFCVLHTALCPGKQHRGLGAVYYSVTQSFTPLSSFRVYLFSYCCYWLQVLTTNENSKSCTIFLKIFMNPSLSRRVVVSTHE